LIHDGSETFGRLLVPGPIFERFTLREVLFLLGRQIGHVIFNHLPLRGDPATGAEKRDADVRLLRGLWRFQELNCDRIGLVCAQDAPIAARALVKAGAGLSAAVIHLDFDALVGPNLRRDDAILADDAHEFELLRIATLVEFGNSTEYHALFEPRTTHLVGQSGSTGSGIHGPNHDSQPRIAKTGVVELSDPDPEFAGYPFRVGETVEVQLDGKWCTGTILAVNPTGDVRVVFPDNEVLRLSPTADIIRPRGQHLAG
jgi:hypothetical protein